MWQLPNIAANLFIYTEKLYIHTPRWYVLCGFILYNTQIYY